MTTVIFALMVWLFAITVLVFAVGILAGTWILLEKRKVK